MSENACILINTGAPAEFYEYSAKDFLVEFLGDKHVIGAPYLIRKAIAKLIAEKRAKSYAEKSASIAVLQDDGSRVARLVFETDKLADRVGEMQANACMVRSAYLYGERNIHRNIADARTAGAKNFYAIPLYPQNCWATTSSAREKFFAEKRAGENFYFKSSYCEDPLYIASLRMSLLNLNVGQTRDFDSVLVTFHGVPCSYLKKTAYAYECEKTFRALREDYSANLFSKKNSSKDIPFFMAWQSNMNFGCWTKPDADSILEELIGRRLKRVAVIPAGFACDCTETIIDLEVELKEKFRLLGGEYMGIASCPNSSESHANLMSKLLTDMINEARWKAKE